MTYVTLPQLVEAIAERGQLASFPTDTVPALATAPTAAAAIYAAKQRTLTKPLILMAGEIEQIWPYVTGSPAEQTLWRSVMQTYWPGALTLVLPASDQVPIAMHPQTTDSIGVRIPNHALARTILRQTGPLATTSANISGQDALLNMRDIAATFPNALQLSATAVEALNLELDCSGTPSTVIKWQGDRWTVLRQGAVILPPAILQAEPRSIQ